MDENPHLAQEPGGEVYAMSDQVTNPTASVFWDVILLLLIGSIFGWFVRTHTLNDRYILALALKHETAAKYYNERTDQLISANQPKTKGATKP